MCSYCYARNSDESRGFSAGLDFETRIIVKEMAPELLRRELSSPPRLKPPRPSRELKAIPGLSPPSHTIWTRHLGAIWREALSIPEDHERLTDLAQQTGETQGLGFWTKYAAIFVIARQVSL